MSLLLGVVEVDISAVEASECTSTLCFCILIRIVRVGSVGGLTDAARRRVLLLLAILASLLLSIAALLSVTLLLAIALLFLTSTVALLLSVALLRLVWIVEYVLACMAKTR